jgi:hypothetical protein
MPAVVNQDNLQVHPLVVQEQPEQLVQQDNPAVLDHKDNLE